MIAKLRKAAERRLGTTPRFSILQIDIDKDLTLTNIVSGPRCSDWN